MLVQIKILFFVDLLCSQMIALGVVFHRGSYLRGLFNILDFFVLIVNVVPIIVYFAEHHSRTEELGYVWACLKVMYLHTVHIQYTCIVYNMYM